MSRVLFRDRESQAMVLSRRAAYHLELADRALRSRQWRVRQDQLHEATRLVIEGLMLFAHPDSPTGHDLNEMGAELFDHREGLDNGPAS